MNEDIDFFISKDYENTVPKIQYVEYNVNKALQFMKNIYPVLDEKTKDDIKLKVLYMNFFSSSVLCSIIIFSSSLLIISAIIFEVSFR